VYVNSGNSSPKRRSQEQIKRKNKKTNHQTNKSDIAQKIKQRQHNNNKNKIQTSNKTTPKVQKLSKKIKTNPWPFAENPKKIAKTKDLILFRTFF